MADLSNFIVDELINHLLRNTAYTSPTTVYASTHTDTPGETGANETVAGGNSYARQAITFDAPVDGVTANSNLLQWTDMPTGNVHSIGIWDSLTTGQFIGGKALTGGTVNLPAGSTFEIAIGALDFTLG